LSKKSSLMLKAPPIIPSFAKVWVNEVFIGTVFFFKGFGGFESQ
jgi:hypothetical protein